MASAWFSAGNHAPERRAKGLSLPLTRAAPSPARKWMQPPLRSLGRGAGEPAGPACFPVATGPFVFFPLAWDLVSEGVISRAALATCVTSLNSPHWKQRLSVWGKK